MGLKKQYIRFKNWVAVTAKKAFLEIKRDTLLIVFGFVCTIAKAQATGAIHTAAEDIQKYQKPVQELMYAIAAVIGIVGAFSVYFKMRASVNGYVLNASLARG